MNIPEKIQNIIETEPYEIDRVGMSGGDVRIFTDKVLKIRTDSEQARNEINAMQWLAGKLSVPHVIVHESKDGNSCLLMTKVKGKMACDNAFMKNPKKLTKLLAKALKKLWAIDISACPLDWTLNKKLQAAEFAVESNSVNIEDAEPETFGENGFKNPEELLKWLTEHYTEQELVLSHGDFCLPNIFIADDETISYIDLGKTGVADKWCDIALCYRSLKHNYAGKYTAEKYPEYDPNMLFEQLGIEPDWEKSNTIFCWMNYHNGYNQRL